MASQGHARPLATTGAIMSTRKQDTDAGCDRWPRGPRSTRLAADTDHGKAERCRCTIATLHIRRLSPSASAGRAACKGCHQSDDGVGAGTIRAMSTAEMPAGEIVSPPARCASRCRCMPARRAWMSQRGRRCRERLQAPTARTCARSRQHFRRRGLLPALRSPCGAGAAGQASCAHLTDDDPMSWRRRAPPFCTSHADDAAARMRRHERQRTRRWIAAAMCARTQSVAAGDTGTVRRQAPAQYGKGSSRSGAVVGARIAALVQPCRRSDNCAPNQPCRHASCLATGIRPAHRPCIALGGAANGRGGPAVQQPGAIPDQRLADLGRALLTRWRS